MQQLRWISEQCVCTDEKELHRTQRKFKINDNLNFLNTALNNGLTKSISQKRNERQGETILALWQEFKKKRHCDGQWNDKMRKKKKAEMHEWKERIERDLQQMFRYNTNWINNYRQGRR